MLMRGAEGRKEERSKQGHKNNKAKQHSTPKAKQHSTPKAVTFPKKNELSRVGLEPTCILVVTKQQTCMSEI